MQENHTTRRRLSDILAGRIDEIREQWDSTEAAADFVPLPAGAYEAHVHSVELFNAKTGTPGVKIQFRVCDGEYVGRKVFHDLWLTPAALPQTKRDCLKLGLDTIDKLDSATVPPGRIRCKVRVALRTGDSGEQFNRVRGFDVLGVDEPEADPFAPAEDAEGDAKPADAGVGEKRTEAPLDESASAEATKPQSDEGMETAEPADHAAPAEGGDDAPF